MARVATDREAIVMFEGKYHGHIDDTMVIELDGKRVHEGRGLAKGSLAHARIIPFNDLDALARVLVVGVGDIGREIARVCKAFGLSVSGVGRTARAGDDDFSIIHAQSDLNAVLPEADYVVLITPLTAETENIFGAEQFSAMKPSAQFINLGRGQLVDETALITALDTGEIASAALDVFREEPLLPENPMWDARNVVISPHMSGDFHGHLDVLAQQFFDNFERYRHAQPLLNIVDKQAGFVPSGS